MLRFSNLKNGKFDWIIHWISIPWIYLSSEQSLEDVLRKRNIEFQQLEDRLRQFEEKVNEWIFFNFISTNVFVFFRHTNSNNYISYKYRLSKKPYVIVKSKMIVRSMNMKFWSNKSLLGLSEQISDLNRALTEKTSLDDLNREKILVRTNRFVCYFSSILIRLSIGLLPIHNCGGKNSIHTKKRSNNMNKPLLISSKFHFVTPQRRNCFFHFRREINDVHRKKQTSKWLIESCNNQKQIPSFRDGEFEESAFQLQITNLENVNSTNHFPSIRLNYSLPRCSKIVIVKSSISSKLSVVFVIHSSL